MSEWEATSRTTPDGQTLRTATAEIDGETWYMGNIPAPPEQPKQHWRRLNNLFALLTTGFVRIIAGKDAALRTWDRLKR